MNRKVIYTCLVGGYDNLLQPKVVDESFDYICFTDDISGQRLGVWEMRPIAYKSAIKSQVSRYPKILPHMELPEYEYSLYMDASLQILSAEFYKSINAKIESGCLIAQVKHCIPPVDCIYDEIVNAYGYNVVTFMKAWKQTRYLRRNHFPKHVGLFENNLIFRKHGNELVEYLMSQWWNEYLKGGPRDQFSLMYVYWKNNYMPDYLLDEDVCSRNTPWLKLHQHIWQRNERPSFRERVIRRMHQITYPYVKYFFV